LKNLRGKFVFSALDLLQAQHVRLHQIEPASNIRDARENGVYVPGSNEHMVD